jgi:hypothetical protein
VGIVILPPLGLGLALFREVARRERSFLLYLKHTLGFSGPQSFLGLLFYLSESLCFIYPYRTRIAAFGLDLSDKYTPSLYTFNNCRMIKA